MSKAQKEAARRFPTGAKVRLSVGGPVMVVDGATADGRVVCRWFDGSKLERAKLAGVDFQAPRQRRPTRWISRQTMPGVVGRGIPAIVPL